MHIDFNKQPNINTSPIIGYGYIFIPPKNKIYSIIYSIKLIKSILIPTLLLNGLSKLININTDKEAIIIKYIKIGIIPSFNEITNPKLLVILMLILYVYTNATYNKAKIIIKI